MKSKLFTLSVLLISIVGQANSQPFNIEEVTSFDEPWAMAFLPDGRILVTEKKGRLQLIGQDGRAFGAISGIPNVDYGGQGGLGDVALHPDFDENSLVYVSYAEEGIGGTRGAAVARGVLDLTGRRGQLTDVEVIWRQYPKTVGYGHYGHRLLFDKDGYLWIASGDRQKFTPSQDIQSNIGKILRLNDDGSIPDDNPYMDYYSEDARVNRGSAYREVWSLGHRNPLGLSLDLDNRLWVIEMGPAHGDELNLITRRGNYGYPVVSNGDHYDGREIPDHDTRPEFIEPAVWWDPAISPGHMMTYTGAAFKSWMGDLFISGLSSQAIIRIEIDGDKAQEAERFEMGARIRSVVQGPEGNLWVLEDERGSSQGRLLKLTP
ncbi:MAG: PQQ-dependent sugar dehydrogenase [Pseudomonadota bacterium]